MYFQYTDILRRIFLYVTSISKYKDEIKHVHLKNDIVEHFGKCYCRIYVDISPIENTIGFLEMQKTIDKRLFGETPFFSFYLPNGTDEHNKIEEVHYNYIQSLLSWFLKDEIKIEADQFKSQRDLKNQEEQEGKQYQEKNKEIEGSIRPIIIEPGYLLAIKSWSSGSGIEIVLLKDNTLPAELSVVKKNLKPGKRKFELRSKTDIYAILQPAMLPDNISKEELLALIKENLTFDGLLWRRPQHLW